MQGLNIFCWIPLNFSYIPERQQWVFIILVHLAKCQAGLQNNKHYSDAIYSAEMILLIKWRISFILKIAKTGCFCNVACSKGMDFFQHPDETLLTHSHAQCCLCFVRFYQVTKLYCCRLFGSHNGTEPCAKLLQFARNSQRLVYQEVNFN